MKPSDYVINSHPDPDSLVDTGSRWASIFSMMGGYAIEFAKWCYDNDWEYLGNDYWHQWSADDKQAIKTIELLDKFKTQNL